jgi:hypothetical protein
MSTEMPEVPHESAAARRAFVVVGMHRSGTSAMTRTLSLLGAALPKQLMPAVKDNNEAGFWEPQAVADLNDEILQAQDSDWDDVFAFRTHHYLSNFDRFYAGRAVELLEQEFNGAEVIVLKDPRISVLINFWERTLNEAGYSTHYVIMVRNPLEIADSLRERDAFPREKSLLLWSSYMIAAERDTRNRDRIFVSYDQLIGDWRSVRRRIEDGTGFPFPRDTAAAANEVDRYLKLGLRHHEASLDDLYTRSDVPEEIKTLYRIFREACEGRDIDRGAIDAIQAELAKMDQLLGPLLADFRGRVRSLTRELSELSEDHGGLREKAEALEQELAAERDARREEATARSGPSRESEEEIQRLADEVVELIRRLAAEEETRASLETLVDQARTNQRVAEAALESEKATAEARDVLISQMQTRLDQSLAGIAELTRELKDSESASKRAGDAHREREADLMAALENSRSENEVSKSRLNERFNEIASLTSMLAEREASDRQAREDLTWLRETTAILLNNSRTAKGHLARILPAVFQVKRQRRLLKQRGLFDGDAYLAANADVAADGVDPLQHYLKHGLSENRRRR